MKFRKEYNLKIKKTFTKRLEDFLVLKKDHTIISPDLRHYTIFFNDSIREDLENLKIEIVIKGEILETIEIQTLNDASKLNEYDLKIYLLELIDKVFQDEYIDKTTPYVIRNYYSYYNSSPFDLDIIIKSNHKIRIHTVTLPAKQEPLTEQILLIDVQLEAINLKHAQSLAYTITKDTCAFLSVLLDVGFKEINSTFKCFIRKDPNDPTKLINERYRTGYIDGSLGILVKDNMQGTKSFYDKNVDKFWTGSIASFFTTDFADYSNATEFIEQLTDNLELDKTFKQLTITSQKKNSFEKDTIDYQLHFPNCRISVPSCIRNYFKGITKLSEKEYKFFLAASRLYNLSLTACKYSTSMEISYKVSCIETLAKAEGLHFGDFVRKYGNNQIDYELLDYCYGNIRSGHFHSGVFCFTEYEIDLCVEFNNILKEKLDLMIKSNSMLRYCFINWININILHVEPLN